MNRTKVQEIISKEIEDYQKSIRWSRQHAPAKWQIEKLTELGLIDLMPAKFGHGDAGQIIKLAEEKDSYVFNAMGEGAETAGSDLNKALNEVEETTDEPETVETEQSFKVGDIVTVQTHTVYQRTTQNDHQPTQHNGYRQAKVTSVDSDGTGGVILEVEINGSYDYVDPQYCVKAS